MATFTPIRKPGLDSPMIIEGIAADLATVNQVITAAVQVWPSSERLKRLALTALHYTNADLQDFEFLLCYKAHACLGVAVWEPENVSFVNDKSSVALLHGLYVGQQHQHLGVGKLLLDEVHLRAEKRSFSGVYVRAERFSASYFEHVGYRQLAVNQGPGAVGCAYPYRFLGDLAARHSNAA